MPTVVCAFCLEEIPLTYLEDGETFVLPLGWQIVGDTFYCSECADGKNEE